jgi:hypothetical protein
MFSDTKSTASAVAALLLFVLIPSAANAQLLGCDDVKCSNLGQCAALCHWQYITATEIGIAALNTNANSETLTWTVSNSVQESITNESSSETLSRSFFFGTPSHFNLSDPSLPWAGCALFFEGISTALAFLARTMTPISVPAAMP